jgi:hypothetical protein
MTLTHRRWIPALFQDHQRSFNGIDQIHYILTGWSFHGFSLFFLVFVLERTWQTESTIPCFTSETICIPVRHIVALPIEWRALYAVQKLGSRPGRYYSQLCLIRCRKWDLCGCWSHRSVCNLRYIGILRQELGWN